MSVSSGLRVPGLLDDGPCRVGLDAVDEVVVEVVAGPRDGGSAAPVWM